MIDEYYRRQAVKAIPENHYILPVGESLKCDDLVWSWTSQEWFRADDDGWLNSPLVHTENMICAIRKIGISDFEKSIPAQRKFVLR